MATLIPEITISDLKKLKAHEIEQLKSHEVFADGKYLCTMVIAQTDYIRTEVEYLGELSNSIKGKEISEIGGEA